MWDGYKKEPNPNDFLTMNWKDCRMINSIHQILSPEQIKWLQIQGKVKTSTYETKWCLNEVAFILPSFCNYVVRPEKRTWKIRFYRSNDDRQYYAVDTLLPIGKRAIAIVRNLILIETALGQFIKNTFPDTYQPKLTGLLVIQSVYMIHCVLFAKNPLHDTQLLHCFIHG